MLGIGDYPLINGYATFYINQYGMIIFVAILESISILKYVRNKSTIINNLIKVAKPIIILFSFILVIIYLVNSTFNPFRYFNF